MSSPRRSSSSSASSARRKAISVMMSRAAAQPSPRSVRAVAQLAVTSREARLEHRRVVLPAMEDASFWEELIDRVLERAPRMSGVQVMPELELDPSTGRLQLLPGTADLRIRASTPTLTDGFVVTVTWNGQAEPQLFLEHPMVLMVVPVAAGEVVTWLYQNPGFLAQDAVWRGEFLMNLVAGLVHGLARADWLRHKMAALGPAAMFPRSTAVALPEDEEDEDATEAALSLARTLLAREAAAHVQDVPVGYIRAYRSLLAGALRAGYR